MTIFAEFQIDSEGQEAPIKGGGVAPLPLEMLGAPMVKGCKQPHNRCDTKIQETQC